MKNFYVYILANSSKKLYVGFTSDLKGRIVQHKSKVSKGFTAQHGIDKLVHYEHYDDAIAAIRREKKLKNQRRALKVALVERKNPDWVELVVE